MKVLFYIVCYLHMAYKFSWVKVDIFIRIKSENKNYVKNLEAAICKLKKMLISGKEDSIWRLLWWIEKVN